MTGRRHKLGGRLLLILLICVVLVIVSLMGTILFTISSYTQNNSIEQAQSSAKTLERKIQELEESSLQYARIIAGNPTLSQAVFSKDTGTIEGILASAVQNSQADFVIVADKGGEALYSTLETSSLSGAAAQAGLTSAQSGGESTILDAEISSRLSAVSIVPVNASGTMIGSLVLGYALDNEKIVDGVKNVLGDDVTIFLGDTRVNTTITKDGKRVVGTQASSSVVDRVLKRGESFSGNIIIEGMSYIVYYMPLKDTAGNTIGILFGGNPQAQTQAAVNQIILISSIFGVVALALLALLLTLYTRRAIGQPLGKLLDTAKQIAAGNLNVDLAIKSRNEIGELSEAFMQMSHNLNEMIGSIDTASEQITEGARQVSTSSVALASGATEQASAVEEFSSSLEQISAQTTQNASRASQANALSRTALTKAEEGNVQMRSMLQAMSEINRSSEVIAKIIKVIDDIAFQTNILALNAAVEAARAGEHGKGFAVVAEEVRNLAARSAEAAKETTSSIGQSIKEVEKGTRIADATANMLSAIVSGVSGTASLVNDIAEACAQQVTAIKQMGQGINQITGVMQSNSATSEQNSAASEELLSQAEFMKKQVSHFTLREEDAPSALPRSIGAEG